MSHLKRTTSSDVHFLELVAMLDADLAIRDGEENAFYTQFNGVVHLKHCVVLYINNVPVACGAFKIFNKDSVEVKRMFVLTNFRGRGIASLILQELEKWALEEKFTYCILETGLRQPEAIALYKKNNYKITTNYPPYENIENSVCFKKML